MNLTRYLREHQKRLLQAALIVAQGTHTRACEMLSLTPEEGKSLMGSLKVRYHNPIPSPSADEEEAANLIKRLLHTRKLRANSELRKRGVETAKHKILEAEIVLLRIPREEFLTLTGKMLSPEKIFAWDKFNCDGEYNTINVIRLKSYQEWFAKEGFDIWQAIGFKFMAHNDSFEFFQRKVEK